MEVKNCPVTQSDTTITKLYGKQKDGTYHTGVDIKATSVYSICNCVVTNVSKEASGTYIVTCQYNSKRCFRYGNLDSVFKAVNDVVLIGHQLGTTKDVVHFEDCITDQPTMFPFRFGGRTYYKVDPLNIVTGIVPIFSSTKNPFNQCP